MTRPEGAALAGGMIICGPRRAWCAGGAALPALAYLGGRLVLVGDFVLTPKLDFMVPMGPLAAPGFWAGVGQYLVGLADAFTKGFEAFGPLAWLLVVVGILYFVRQRKWRRIPGASALVVTLLLALLGMALFQVKRRFLVDWTPLLLCFGALAWTLIPRKWAPLLPLLLLVAVAADLWRLRPARKADRADEVALARWIGKQLTGSQSICTDMPRIAYYAGRRPPPPRVPTVGDLTARCAAPAVTFLVLGTRRPLLTAFGPPPSWQPAILPPTLAAAAQRRGVKVFKRRKN